MREYWIVDWQRRELEIYRRNNAQLTVAVTVLATDVVQSPSLPGFAVRLSEFF
jgi:Uma2 family endonuclease